MRTYILFFAVLLATFAVDQAIKLVFVEGYYRAGSCIDLELHFNKGVAFSMFAFLGDYLKWIQASLVVGIFIFVLKEGYIKRYGLPLGMLLGGALGNVFDRFIHEGVVDYVAWHCGFNFAVFNFADAVIDIGVFWILVVAYFFTEDATQETHK